jgi:hypothetical protein
VRSNDALITGKVKAAIIDTQDLYLNAFKVHTDRSVVYLMGRVTEEKRSWVVKWLAMLPVKSTKWFCCSNTLMKARQRNSSRSSR